MQGTSDDQARGVETIDVGHIFLLEKELHIKGIK